MLYKNTPASEWPGLFIKRGCIDAIAMARALVTGNFGELRAIVRAYSDAHSMSKKYKDQRPASVPDTARPSYKRSIVLDYFLHGRKRFQDLPEDGFD